MEEVFIAITLIVFTMWATANYTAKGIGSMSDAARQFSLFILVKAM